MSTHKLQSILFFTVLGVSLMTPATHCVQQNSANGRASFMRIQDIVVHGNRTVSTETILSYFPYRVGGIFDPIHTKRAITNVYQGLKRFRTISLSLEQTNQDFVILHLYVSEKYPLVDIDFKGNYAVSSRELREKIVITDIPAIDEIEIEAIAQKIKDLYLQKGYHTISVATALEIVDDRAYATFTIDEGKRAVIKEIEFVGNDHVTSATLRSIVITKEDWVLSFLDQAGYFHKEKLEADKYFIQQHYKNIGYVHAHVKDIDILIDEQEHMKLIFHIHEGSCYTINEIQLLDDETLSGPRVLDQFEELAVGNVYSLEQLRTALTNLENFWKNQGYIFTHVEPIIQLDEAKKTVSTKLRVEKNNQMHLNNLKITGNRKTRRKVILRNLVVEEGKIVTQYQLDRSKYAVEALGYFEQDGVQWKLKRIDDKKVDLELVVKEGKTGHAGFSFTYGGDTTSLQSPLQGFSFKGELSDSNLFGHGINAMFNATLSREEQALLLHVAQPWLFDKPIFSAFDFYHKRPTYIMFHHIERGSVNEKLTGGLATLGYTVQTSNPWFVRLSFLGACGVENIAYNHLPKAAFFQDQTTTEEYQFILDQEFIQGTYVFLTFSIDQDLRNHPIHTSRGHKLKINTRVGISPHEQIGFCKFDTDFIWYTPLIGETDLVFKFRGYAGFITAIANKNIPFGELYLLGGQNSIRGFEFGQAGPQFQDDPIGGKKGIFVSADFIFPIMPDLSMKAVFFYNGGAGFDNPYAKFVSKDNIRNNNFDYRHAVGFGIRLLKPTAISVDWGFKIDPRKNKQNPRLNETTHEVHFVMGYDF